MANDEDSDAATLPYIVGVWFIAGHEQDWLANVGRTSPDDPDARLEYRFRYYSGSKDPFDGSDHKAWYRATIARKTDDEIIAAMDGMADRLVAVGYALPGEEPWRGIVRGDHGELLRVMSKAPFAHLKYEQE